MLLRFNYNSDKAIVQLPGSKSISNRLLILNEVLELNLKLQNLSSAKDTQDLIIALNQIKNNKNHVIDIGHAGTDMRFLTALLSTKEGEWTLTGSERMKQRPIKELVDALKQIGAQISYLQNEGFPPLKIIGKKLKGGKVEIDGSVSSQFISALILIAPALENGLEIKIKNEIVSWPYIQMTLDLLKETGVEVSTLLNTIIISAIHPKVEALKTMHELVIESDWSGASYWYSIVALSKNFEITLKGLDQNSSQGDSVLPEIYKSFGISSEFINGNLLLTKKAGRVNYFEYDFTNCPDIAQTVAVTCLGLKIDCRLNGLSTLKHKETDRILALKNELEKFEANVNVTNDSLQIMNSKSDIRNSKFEISTYKDHRMAMSFAPLTLIYDNINIEDPQVVKKSYPEFWEHLKLVGIGG